MVFQSNNIAKLVLLKDGKPVSTTNFTYEVDEKNKLLITEWDNRTMISEIVKLHNDQLFLKRPSTNTHYQVQKNGWELITTLPDEQRFIVSFLPHLVEW